MIMSQDPPPPVNVLLVSLLLCLAFYLTIAYAALHFMDRC